MVGIRVANVAALAESGNGDHRDAGAVAEEVELLHVTGVVGSAALVEGDKDGGVVPKVRICLNPIDNLLNEALEQVQFRGRGMAVDETARLDPRNGRQFALRDA